MTEDIYMEFKDIEHSWNNFFDCPFCKKYRFRVCLDIYETPYWDSFSINALCLNCGFAFKKSGDINGFINSDEMFDSVDFIDEFLKKITQTMTAFEKK